MTRPTPERLAQLRQWYADQRSEDDGRGDELLAEIDALTQEAERDRDNHAVMRDRLGERMDDLKGERDRLAAQVAADTDTKVALARQALQQGEQIEALREFAEYAIGMATDGRVDHALDTQALRLIRAEAERVLVAIQR